ncbi:MAG: hypothetical protein WC975_15900 [Phycisphaerae bacterium]
MAIHDAGDMQVLVYVESDDVSRGFFHDSCSFSKTSISNHRFSDRSLVPVRIMASCLIGVPVPKLDTSNQLIDVRRNGQGRGLFVGGVPLEAGPKESMAAVLRVRPRTSTKKSQRFLKIHRSKSMELFI